jgi:hypothetical protein
MRPVSHAASAMRHSMVAVVEALLVALILATLLLGLSPVSRPAQSLAGIQSAQAGAAKPSIQVVFGTSPTARTSSTAGSIFTSFGCGFRANNRDYYMVVRGPAPDTASLAYWVDPFAVGADGCGNSTVSWTSSGVVGDFQVWVVRSASGNPWQAQPVSNTVTVTITSL